MFYLVRMKRLLITLAFGLIIFNTSAQGRLLVDSVSEYKWSSPTILSDIWGYQDTTGVEYALVCRRRGFSVISLADTLNPVEVYSDTSIFSIWRDVKTWKKHAYVVNESGLGMEIYDLSKLPDSVAKVGTYTGTTIPFQTAHNIFIDSVGVAYLFGTNNNLPGGGTVMLDVDTDPKNPIDLGNFDSLYLHDGVVRDSILYGGAVYSGRLIVVDVRNKSNPQIIGSVQTPNSFTHNVWLSDDGNTAFTTDEVSGAFVASYDVSNPANIIPLDRIRTRNTTTVIPHNTHVLNDFLVTSYYTAGVSIVDGSRPDHLVEVGYFDTSPFSGGTFNGNWGAYPYLPSGLLILSDMEEGLFVVRPKYQRASYLEGNITDCNQNAIAQAKVKILNEGYETNTNLLGDFDLGNVLNGFYTLEVSAPNYATRTIDSVELRPGIVQFLNIELQDTNRGFIHTVVDNQNSPINGALVTIENADTSLTQTIANGKLAFLGLDFGTYNIYVGSWGYENVCIENFVFDCNNDSLSHTLNVGYEDDFNNDLGWSVFNLISTTTGWNRVKPRLILDNNSVAAPSSDDSLDCGNTAYLTIDDTSNLSLDTISILHSPAINFLSYSNPYINLSYWFYNGSSSASDYLEFFLEDTTGGSSLLIGLDTIFFNPSGWNYISYQMSNFTSTNRNARFAIRAIANSNTNSNVFFGIDNFSITEGLPVGVTETTKENDLLIYPNPFSNEFRIEFKTAEQREISIYNLQMQLIYQESSNGNRAQLNLDEAQESGVYILVIKDARGNLTQKKIIKL